MPSSVLNRISRGPGVLGEGPQLSPFQARVDELVGDFVREATNPITLTSLMVGGMAYRAGRIGTLALRGGYATPSIFLRAGALPLRFFSYGIGLGSEVAAYEFTNRSLLSFSQSSITRHPSPNFWSWSGPGGWREGLASSALTFGLIRGAGFLAREQNIVVQHFFQSTAMVAGEQTAGFLKLLPRPEGTLAEQLLHAEITNIQLGVGAGLLYSMAPRIHSFERSLDLSLVSSSRFQVSRWRTESLTPFSFQTETGLSLPTSGHGEILPLQPIQMAMSGKERGGFGSSSGRGRWGISETTPIDVLVETVRRIIRSHKERGRFVFEGISRPLQKESHVKESLELIGILGEEALGGDLSATATLLDLRGALVEGPPSQASIRAAIDLTESYLGRINPERLFGNETRLKSSRQLLDQVNIIEGLVEFNEAFKEDLPRLPWSDWVETIFERLFQYNTLIKKDSRPPMTSFFKTEQMFLLKGLIGILSLNQRFPFPAKRMIPPASHLEGILKEVYSDFSLLTDRVRVYLGLPVMLNEMVGSLQRTGEKIDPRIVMELELSERIPPPVTQHSFNIERIIKSFNPNSLERSDYILFLEALRTGVPYQNAECLKQLVLLAQRDAHAFLRLLDFAWPSSADYDPQAHLALLEVLPFVEASVRMARIPADRHPEFFEIRRQADALWILRERFPPRLEANLFGQSIQAGGNSLALSLKREEAEDLVKFLRNAVQTSSSIQDPLGREKALLDYFQRLPRNSLPPGYLRLL